MLKGYRIVYHGYGWCMRAANVYEVDIPLQGVYLYVNEASGARNRMACNLPSLYYFIQSKPIYHLIAFLSINNSETLFCGSYLACFLVLSSLRSSGECVCVCVCRWKVD